MEPPHLKKRLPFFFLDLKKLALMRKPSTLCCTSSVLGLVSAQSCLSHPQTEQMKSWKPENPPVPLAQPPSHRQVRGLGPAQSDVAELLSSGPTSTPIPPPAWELSSTDSVLPPPQRSTGAPAALVTDRDITRLRAGQKEQAYAPGVFSTPQEAFEGTKGMMVFQTQGPEHLSWKAIVLPPTGQAWGFVLGNTLSRDIPQETKQFSVETQTTKGRVLAPAQDTPGAPRVGV